MRDSPEIVEGSAVLLLDDGELDDVQDILEGLGVPFGRVRGSAIAEPTPTPRELLVTTPRRISSVARGGAGGPVRMVVVNEDSTTLRAQLRSHGFDYLVRRPVHPEALRLLLMHCLYRGDERRREERVPVGLEVHFRTGLLPRRATLIDVSLRGCRLLTPHALEPGMRIKVQLPAEMGSSEPLTVDGRVLRIHLDERPGSDGLYNTAVTFPPLELGVRRELEAIIRGRANGRISIQPPAAQGRARETLELVGGADPVPSSAGGEAPRAAALDEAAAAELDGSERRKARRSVYDRDVPAFGESLRVLVGRDLSVGGMRIQNAPHLSMGDRVQLAIYGEACEEPVIVWATVSRDDGDAGMAVVFDAVPADQGQRLEMLVVSLPAVEPLQESEAGAMGSVVSKILDG